jgi:transcriptional regulator with PAS, ATPase and Fis domain
LRERYDDILPLAMRFLNDNNRHYQRSCRLSAEAIELLLSYQWPGNVRELRNVIERLVVMTDGDLIEPSSIRELSNLATENNHNGRAAAGHSGEPGTSLRHRVEAFERECIADVIKRTKTLREAADILKIDISTLVRKRQKPPRRAKISRIRQKLR